jgi:hypothetical protein
MKYRALILVGFLFSVTIAVAAATEDSDDPLLDARIEVATLRLNHTENSPILIEAEVRFDAISKNFSETPAEYRDHLQERIVQAEIEESVLRLHYTDKHPKMIMAKMRMSFLRQELQRTDGTIL